MSKELKAPDKVTQKMTRDWAARHELRLVKTVQYTKESTC